LRVVWIFNNLHATTFCWHTFRWYWWFHSIILSINRFHGILTNGFYLETNSQNTMEAINRKYDGMEPPVPTKRVHGILTNGFYLETNHFATISREIYRRCPFNLFNLIRKFV